MSLEKQLISFVCTCDTCGDEELDTETENFFAAIEEVKKEGWRIRKDKKGEWSHDCPTCREIYGKSLFEQMNGADS